MKRKQLKRMVKVLESMRPQWAEGYSSDSIAAQCSSAALQQLWQKLGVSNQTNAFLVLTQWEKEAQRYRLIRDIPVYDTGLAVAKVPDYRSDINFVQGELLDAAIDAELKRIAE